MKSSARTVINRAALKTEARSHDQEEQKGNGPPQSGVVAKDSFVERDAAESGVHVKDTSLPQSATVLDMAQARAKRRGKTPPTVPPASAG